MAEEDDDSPLLERRERDRRKQDESDFAFRVALAETLHELRLGQRAMADRLTYLATDVKELAHAGFVTPAMLETALRSERATAREPFEALIQSAPAVIERTNMLWDEANVAKGERKAAKDAADRATLLATIAMGAAALAAVVELGLRVAGK